MSGPANSKMLPQKNTSSRLHAYTESPLLKNDFVPVRNPIHSRKTLNYEDSEKMLVVKAKDPINDTCKLYQ
jgi:hypothetical protein